MKSSMRKEISSVIEGLYADEKKGLLCCIGQYRIFTVDLDTGKRLDSYKHVENWNQAMWSEDKSILVVKNTVGHFKVFHDSNFAEPVWDFTIKRIDNTDGIYIFYDNKLYGTATGSSNGCAKYYKLPESTFDGILHFVIDLDGRTVTCRTAQEMKTLLPPGAEYDGLLDYRLPETEQRSTTFFKKYFDTNEVPQPFRRLADVTGYYQNDRSCFVGTMHGLYVAENR